MLFTTSGGEIRHEKYVLLWPHIFFRIVILVDLSKWQLKIDGYEVKNEVKTVNF